MRAKFITCLGLLAVVLALLQAPALAQPTGEEISGSAAAGIALTAIGGGVPAALGNCRWSACARAAAVPAELAGTANSGAGATASAGLSARSSLATGTLGKVPAGGPSGTTFTSGLGSLGFGGAGSNGPTVIVVTAGSGSAESGDGAHRLFSPSPEEISLLRRRRDSGFPPSDPGSAPGSIVPEPCSLALFALGFIGLAVPLRRFFLA